MSSVRDWIAIAVFALTYVLISGRRSKFLPLDRPAAALLGAVLMVVGGVLTPAQVYQSIDFNTIVLLLGMMLITAYLHLAGFFAHAADWILQHARTPRRLLLHVLWISALLSALFVNDPVCLLLTPLVVAVIVRGRLPLLPYLIALATSSNIGSVATLVGNPQCMIIGNFSGLSFLSYSAIMLPVALLSLAVNYAILSFAFRKTLHDAVIPASASNGLASIPLDRPLIIKVLIVFALVLAGFATGYNLAWTSLAGAAVIMLIGRRDTRDVLQRVDWQLLVFFAGLFVVVSGLNQTGFPDKIFTQLLPYFGNSKTAQAWNLTWFSVIGSNLFSNVPFVLVAGHWMNRFADPALLWKILALSTTFAGNLTILGSVANIIVVESARPHIEIGFWDYAKYGIPITLLTTLIGTAFLLLLQSLS